MPYVLKTGIVFSIYLCMSVSLIKVFQSFNENMLQCMLQTIFFCEHRPSKTVEQIFKLACV